MALVTLTDVHVAFSGHTVLDGASMSLHDGEIVGLIGPNGSGKTTLLRSAAGSQPLDAGRVDRRKGLRIGFLEQEPVLPEEATVHDAALSAFVELLEVEQRMRDVEHKIARSPAGERHALLERLGCLQERFDLERGYELEGRVGAVLAGVGFSQEEFIRPVSVLSGGERARLALARLLLRDAELLLLDEPTNHLDLAGIEWLEEFLRTRFNGGALVVSHDRLFLDRTVRRILDLEDGRLVEYPGNYSKHAELKAHRRLEQERLYEKQRAFIEKEEQFIRRYHAAQRGREARGRQKRLNRIERIEAPKDRKSMSVRFDPLRESAELCFRAEELAKRFGEQKLFSGLNLEVYRGDCVGIIGPNGSGKSTLLKLLMEELPPDAGSIQKGRHVHVGYLPQQADILFSRETVLDEVWERNRKLDEVQARSLLGRFLFSGDDAVAKAVSDLSGGERTRLALACLMVERPNLLLLDEPTNHLDIASCEALEEAIEDFEGTVVMVSHDRYLINRLVNKLVALDGRGGSQLIHGNYETYEQRRSRQTRPAGPPPEKRPAAEPERKRTKKLSKNRLAQLEEDISRLELEKSQIEAQLADPALYADRNKARTLPRRYDELCRQLDDLYTLWSESEHP
jgi:ATP-binding cassette subfamily F protein 3